MPDEIHKTIMEDEDHVLYEETFNPAGYNGIETMHHSYRKLTKKEAEDFRKKHGLDKNNQKIKKRKE